MPLGYFFRKPAAISFGNADELPAADELSTRPSMDEVASDISLINPHTVLVMLSAYKN